MTNPPRRGAPVLLWLIALLSLALNVVIIGIVIAAALFLRGIAGQAADKLEALGNSTIATNVRVNRDIAIDITVPFDYVTEIPIEQNVPIETTVKIQQDVPLIGEVNFDVPIKTNVPISVKVPINIKRSIPIKTSIPLNIDVPVAIQVRDTPLKAQIDEFVTILRSVAGK